MQKGAKMSYNNQNLNEPMSTYPKGFLSTPNLTSKKGPVMHSLPSSNDRSLKKDGGCQLFSTSFLE